MTTIRTPDDEIDKPGYFYPPFAPGRTYQGITYGGHSDYAVDWNRRTPAGGWLPDDGDPVHAAAAGTVKATNPAEGYVLLAHSGGFETEYRHMQPVLVKPGDKVQRGDVIGRIGDAGNAPNGTHLHMRAYKDGKPIKLRLEGQNVTVSIGDSDSRPSSWTPPAPVYVQGPPPRATWESAYREAAKLAEKRSEQLEAQKAQTKLALDERDAARAAEQLAKEAADGLRTELTAANAALKACREQPIPTCDAAVNEEVDAILAWVQSRKRGVVV